MSPVFRHGRLRLYLLKLLDESPRHGYEVIRLLQDRFLGVYAPSPGTIYPRLARLEEDGLVTHEEVDGKKVYSITDKGREEIRSRLSDLADLEDELTESLRDVAREISEDVRETVRGIREELTSAFRSQQAGRTGGPADTARGAASGGATSSPPAGAGDNAGFPADAGTGSSAGNARSQAGTGQDDETAWASDEARRIREEARRTREDMRAKFRARNRGERGSWQDRIGWADWASWSSWSDSAAEDSAAGESGTERPTGAGQRAGRGAANAFSDLERMAIQFASELRTAAKQAGNVGERSLSDLRDILTDTLAKVRVEVFTESSGDTAEPGTAKHAPAGSPEAGEPSARDPE
jgi:DNA-binding PadR family transcriptional regulator